MEDVIFNGAEQRKPLGMAECTLTLETDSAFPGSDGRPDDHRPPGLPRRREPVPAERQGRCA